MALKPLQSAVYPPAEPKLQTGLTLAEIDADYRRFDRARRAPGTTPEAWPRWEEIGGKVQARKRRAIQGY